MVKEKMWDFAGYLDFVAEPPHRPRRFKPFYPMSLPEPLAKPRHLRQLAQLQDGHSSAISKHCTVSGLR